MAKRAMVAALTVVGALCASGRTSVGYMLDISRDKVPTTETLHRVVDVIAGLGYNEFQLYTEHTFAFTNHATAWRGCSPMTAAEIRALDDYCARRGVELVPNQNSFGHLEKWFRHDEYRPLAEVPQGGVKTPWGSVIEIPRALCPTDPRSIAFVSSLYDELLPNFRSKFFNVGCDEVWELESQGKGRSWSEVQARGRERVWLDYFRKVCGLAERHGRTVLFWDDMIVRKHPELIPELPKNAIAIEWGYELKKGHDATIYDRDCRNLRDAGYPFYVCPGTSGWNAMTGRHANMKTNVDEAVSAGLKYGARGFLMADWGNGGACQPWVTALPALVYMRERMNGVRLTDGEIAARVDRIAGCRCGKALIRYQNLYLKSGTPDPFNNNTLYLFMCGKKRHRKLTDERLADVFAELAAARQDLDLAGAPPWVRDGFATMDLLFEALHLRWKGEDARLMTDIAPRFRELWLRHNRPGGLEESVQENFAMRKK